MLVIHIIHRLTKLFTLKRSRKVVDFTLKRSRFSAETLPHSIYAFIYLYKKTCSYQLTIVNNFFLKTFLFILLTSLLTVFVSACCKKINPSEIKQNAALHLTTPPPRTFQQLGGNAFQPDAYFACGKIRLPCPYISKIGKSSAHKKLRNKRLTHFHSLGDKHEKRTKH